MTDEMILNALKNACARAGNQLELARRTGLSQGQISDYICGRRKVKNMTIGTFEKIFPKLTVAFFPDQASPASDPVEYEILRIIRDLTAAEKAKCLKILAANFSDKVLSDHPREP